MKSEVYLFLKGIKPSILMSNKSLIRHGIIDNKLNLINKNHYKVKFRNGFIISHYDIPEIDNDDLIKLGKILGYYPKACDRFYDTQENAELIEFGGIKFNTFGLFDEALEWCKEMYSDKMLQEFEQIKYHKITLIRENSRRKISNVGIITRN